MRRLVAVATLAACLTGPTSALAQNDWQFPDPYFGALEFDVSRPSGQRQRRVESAPAPRLKSSRQRPFRTRPRWSSQGTRP
jgi:hypothetical protein